MLEPKKILILVTFFVIALAITGLSQEMEIFIQPEAGFERALGPQADLSSEIETNYRLGEETLREKKWEEAMASFTKVLAIDPNHADARDGFEEAAAGFRRDRTMTLLKTGGPIAIVVTIISLALSYRPLRRRAQRRKETQRIEEEKHSTEEAVQTHLANGRDYLRLGDFNEALKAAETVFDHDAHNVEAIDLFVEVCMKSKRSVEALGLLKKELNLRPDDPFLLRKICQIYQSKNETGSDAVRVYRIILSKEPDNLALHLLLAKSYMSKNDLGGATKEYRTILQLDPNRWMEVKKGYNNLIEINPGNYSLHLDLAEVYYLNGKLTEALNEYKKGLFLNPELEDEILKRYSRFLKEHPDSTQIKWEIANLQLQRGYLDEALEGYKGVIEQDESYLDRLIDRCEQILLEDVAPDGIEDVHFFLGELYYQNDDIAKGREHIGASFKIEGYEGEALEKLVVSTERFFLRANESAS